MANWSQAIIDQVGRTPLKRARSAVHFDMGGGFVAHCVGKPIHYHDGVDWRAIDTALRLDSGSNQWRGTGTPVSIAPDGTVHVDSGGWTQRTSRIGLYRPSTKTFIAVRTLPAFAASDDTLIREQGAWRHELRVLEDGLRESLTILSRPTGLGAQAGDYLVIETLVDADDWADADEVGEFAHSGFQFHLPMAYDAARSVAPVRRIALRDGSQPRLLTGVPVSWLATAAYPVTIDPDFAGGTADGYIYGSSNQIATARSTSSYVYTAGPELEVGMMSVPTKYVLRSFVVFDTSSIGAGSNVTQVNQKYTVTSDSSSTDFDVQIVALDWSGQSPVTDANRETVYDNCLSVSLDAIWQNMAGLSANTPYTSANLSPSWVNKTGLTYYGLRSERDYSNARAGQDGTMYSEYAYLASANHATPAYRPILTVLYSAGGGISVAVPTVGGVSVAGAVPSVSGGAVAALASAAGVSVAGLAPTIELLNAPTLTAVSATGQINLSWS